MTAEEAIHKSIEGGYHVYTSDGAETFYSGSNNCWSVWTRKDNHSSFVVFVHETFMDCTFWQALGRALGWEDKGSQDHVCPKCCDWLRHWHRFIDHLAAGNKPQSFFEGFPKEKKHKVRKGRISPRCDQKVLS